MYISKIEWLEGERIIKKDSLSSLLDWLTNLYDATGQMPKVENENGEQIAIKYDARGNARLA